MNAVPITLISGYLGAGKTTLLNRILANQKGCRAAVIVNDVGEVNIDAELIERKGVVTRGQNNLLALTNGCICCSLQDDFLNQVISLILSGQFDRIIIEASGLGDPASIVGSITKIDGTDGNSPYPALARLEHVITVVDAKRMTEEFSCGKKLVKPEVNRKVCGGPVSLRIRKNEPEDVEGLLIHQIEFSSMIILNKVSCVSAEEKERVLQVIRGLQPKAELLETDYCNVDVLEVLGAGHFELETVKTSMTWMQMFEQAKMPEAGRKDKGREHSRRQGIHSKYRSHHYPGIASHEIRSFVYDRRRPFNRKKLEHWIDEGWPQGVIRCKGIVWFHTEPCVVQVFEQAGSNIEISPIGIWAAADEELEVRDLPLEEQKDWDETYGDRKNRLVFIGRQMNEAKICRQLDGCLED